MKTFIFDIDGCILPSVFPNLTDSRQSEGDIKEIVKECNEKGKTISLYPNFISFYKKHCKYRKSFFITGRKRSHFSELTKKQLNSISNENVIFYPEELDHTRRTYSSWKFEIISKLIKQNGFCYVFDDDNSYFNWFIISECICLLANSDRSWNILKNCNF